MGMIGMIGGIITCFNFSRIYLKFKRYTPAVFSIIIGLGYLGLSFPVNLAIIAIASFLIAGFASFSFTYYLMFASMIVPPARADLSIAIANAAVYGGLFVAPYVAPLYQAVFGGELMVDSMPLIAGTLCICAIISFVLGRREKKLSDTTN